MNNKKLEEFNLIIGDGNYSSKYPKGEEFLDYGIPFLSASDFKDKTIDYTKSKKISPELHNQLKKGHVQKGDLLIVVRGNGVGKTGYIDDEIDECNINAQLAFIRSNDASLDNEYLYYNMKYNFEKLKSLATGSAQPQLVIGNLVKYSLSVPSIENQTKIKTILSNIDEKIKLNNEINNNLQELINDIFISKFVNYYGYTGEYEMTEIGDIPSNWKVDNLGNVISFSNGYGWNSKDMLENNQPDTYKVFKMGNIKIGGGINKEKTRSWILKEKCSGLEQFLSKKGDILMCMTDMKSSENPLLGHTALIDCDDEFVINQRVGIIRCDKDIRWPYIYTMTNLPFFINNVRSKAHSGVQVNLTTSGICDTKVLIPDKDSLEEFYKNVTPMYEEMFILNNEIEKLEELRDSLLPKLMNGEIDLDNIEI